MLEPGTAAVVRQLRNKVSFACPVACMCQILYLEMTNAIRNKQIIAETEN